jgi:crotonobetainyl-CoA:carnitine CoA-transferase CaiB-like acyl-CoA transferase
VRQFGVAIKLSETPGSVRSAAPLSGEHTDVVLKDLGYGVDDIQALRARKVVE